MAVRKDFYVQLLRYVRDQGTATLKEIETGLEFNDPEIRLLTQQRAITQVLLCPVGSQGVYALAPEGSFHLLEYEELQEARQSSKDAKRQSLIALWVAIVLGVLSLLVGIWRDW